MSDLERYSVIKEKNPREIVLLRGFGCTWRRCRFCDYHLDFCKDAAANFALNKEVLSHVTGESGVLEVINSGSFCDLDDDTMQEICRICTERQIHQIHFECYWKHRSLTGSLRQRFSSIGVKAVIKTGVETFDALFRECYLDKGIDTDSPEEIAAYFDEVCLLQGIPGQTEQSMRHDIETGLQYFKRVCVNIMTPNTSHIKPDPTVIRVFRERVYPLYRDNPRVDILMQNTDFGVG